MCYSVQKRVENTSQKNPEAPANMVFSDKRIDKELFLVLWEKKMTRITIRTGYFFYFF
jgi:hypothetical protein